MKIFSNDGLPLPDSFYISHLRKKVLRIFKDLYTRKQQMIKQSTSQTSAQTLHTTKKGAFKKKSDVPANRSPYPVPNKPVPNHSRTILRVAMQPKKKTEKPYIRPKKEKPAQTDSRLIGNQKIVMIGSHELVLSAGQSTCMKLLIAAQGRVVSYKKLTPSGTINAASMCIFVIKAKMEQQRLLHLTKGFEVYDARGYAFNQKKALQEKPKKS